MVGCASPVPWPNSAPKAWRTLSSASPARTEGHVMGKLIHIEFYKLRTVRAPLLLLALCQLVVVAGVSGLALSADDLHDPKAAPQALAHAGLVSLITLVLGIMAVAGEYRNKTITDTYLSTPPRGPA